MTITHLCTDCGKSFTEEALLLIHQTRVHDKTSYSCDECGADVIGKVSLSNHKRRHKIPAVRYLRKHKCEKCPYESEERLVLLLASDWRKFLNVNSARRSWLPPRSLGTNAQCMERKGGNNIFAKHAISLCKHKQDWSTTRNAFLKKDLRRSLLVRNASTLP